MADHLPIKRSPLSRTILWAGQSVRVEIYKIGLDDWTLELAGGISVIWLRSFPTDTDAFAELVDQADSFGFPALAAGGGAAGGFALLTGTNDCQADSSAMEAKIKSQAGYEAVIERIEHFTGGPEDTPEARAR